MSLGVCEGLLISHQAFPWLWFLVSLRSLRELSRWDTFGFVKRALTHEIFTLSSPRAESARAVTGRRFLHSGEGENFLSRQPDFFYENCCNSGTESRKIDPKVGN